MSSPRVNDIWSKVCKHLEKLLHPDVYSRWIAVIQPKDMTDETITLSVDNDFYQTWLEENYLSLIQDALSAIHDSPLKIIFTVTPQGSQPVPAEPPPKTLRERFVQRSLAKPVLNPKFVFEEFIVGPSNSFAHAASLAVAQAPARAYNPLFIYGGVGLGKTHLMQAIGHHVLSSSRASVCYLSSESLLNEYIEALTKRNLVQFRKKYRTTDLLLIDDIHFLAGKNQLQEEFFHTFNALFDAHKQIVMTSDRPANEIAGLEQRLVSRFEWGLVTELEQPDLETRIAILRHKQEQMKISVPNDVVLFVAENVRSNIRRLEGALIRIVSYASLTGQPPTVDSVRHLLRDTLEKEEKTDLSFGTIQKAVANYYDVRLADMTSKRRFRGVAMPRQIAMYLCRHLTRASLPDIAGAFCKTHATVLHAFKSIDSRLQVEPDLKRDINQISEKLGVESL